MIAKSRSGRGARTGFSYAFSDTRIEMKKNS